MRPPVRAWLRSLAVERRDDLPPVEVDDTGVVAIACGGVTHTARIVAGRFVLDHHDPEAETTLMAFGADPPDCLVYEAVWDAAARDTFLAEWAVDADEDRLAKTAEDWHGNFWESWPAEPSAARVLFGPRLQRKLAVSTARAWVERSGVDGPGSAWGDVRRAVASRARRAIVLSLADVDAHRRPDALVPMSVTVVPEGGPRLEGRLSRHRSRVEAVLPARWLWEVWARDAALLGGRFVLDLDRNGVASLVEWRPSGAGGREHRPVVTRGRL